MSDKLGNRMKQLRQKANMTQSELARSLNVFSALISAYELGERKPSLKVLTQLADFFHVSSDYLLGINSSFLQDIDELSYEEILAVQTFIDMLHTKKKKSELRITVERQC